MIMRVGRGNGTLVPVMARGGVRRVSRRATVSLDAGEVSRGRGGVLTSTARKGWAWGFVHARASAERRGTSAGDGRIVERASGRK